MTKITPIEDEKVKLKCMIKTLQATGAVRCTSMDNKTKYFDVFSSDIKLIQN